MPAVAVRVLVVVLVLVLADAAAATRPNVLFIAVDDLRGQFGESYNTPEVLTPNIDRYFLGQGSVFQRSYVQIAVCGPSRSSFLTSRRPDSTHVAAGSWCWEQRGKFMTLPYYFRQNGYVTAGNGKIFHPDACTSSGDPHSVGDDRRAWTLPYFDDNRCVQWGCFPCPKTPYWNNTMGLSWIISNYTDLEEPDGRLSVNGVEHLRNFSAQGVGLSDDQPPFFLAVGLHKPHLPHIVPKKWYDLYDIANVSLAPNRYVPKNYPAEVWYNSDEMRSYTDAGKRFQEEGFSESHPIADQDAREHRRAYFAATSFTDSNIGRVMDALHDYGFANRTIVVLASDHGWHLGDTNSWAKMTNFETATRNTLAFVVPGQAEASKGQVHDIVEMVDLFPTLADLAGIPVPKPCDEVLCTQGTSYADLFRTGTSPLKQKVAISQWPKLNGMGYALRTEQFRYIEWVGYNFKSFTPVWATVHARELYDYSVDPHETNNVVNDPAYASQVQALQATLHGLVPNATSSSAARPSASTLDLLGQHH